VKNNGVYKNLKSLDFILLLVDIFYKASATKNANLRNAKCARASNIFMTFISQKIFFQKQFSKNNFQKTIFKKQFSKNNFQKTIFKKTIFKNNFQKQFSKTNFKHLFLYPPIGLYFACEGLYFARHGLYFARHGLYFARHGLYFAREGLYFAI